MKGHQEKTLSDARHGLGANKPGTETQVFTKRFWFSADIRARCRTTLAQSELSPSPLKGSLLYGSFLLSPKFNDKSPLTGTDCWVKAAMTQCLIRDYCCDHFTVCEKEGCIWRSNKTNGLSASFVLLLILVVLRPFGDWGQNSTYRVLKGTNISPRLLLGNLCPFYSLWTFSKHSKRGLIFLSLYSTTLLLHSCCF